MTRSDQWKLARWLKRHGPAKRSELPKWVPEGLYGKFDFFTISYKTTEGGWTKPGPEDVFSMTDTNIDAYTLERRRRVHEFRDWLEPAGVVTATVISLIALVVSLLS